ncbi:MAG: hypothetical protein VCA35_02875, partial [Roseibacillus sp.]
DVVGGFLAGGEVEHVRHAFESGIHVIPNCDAPSHNFEPFRFGKDAIVTEGADLRSGEIGVIENAIDEGASDFTSGSSD